MRTASRGREVDDLVAELGPARPGQHDVDLLGLGVAVRERAAAAGAQPEVGDAGPLGTERRTRDARLPVRAEAVGGRGVLDRVEVDQGVGHRLGLLGSATAACRRSSSSASVACSSSV